MKRSVALVTAVAALLFLCAGSVGAAAEKEKVIIDMFGSQLGSQGYVAMYAASEVINKHHPWIRATVHETFGALDNVRRLDTDVSLRKHALFMTSLPAMYGARAGKPKEMFPRQIKGIMNVFNSTDATYILVTTNPAIKTPLDFAGKRVDVGAYGNFQGVIGDYLLDAYGSIKSKIAKLEHNADQNVMYNNLKDGKVDVCMSGNLKMGEKMSPTASTRELMASRTIYPVGYSKEIIKKVAALSGIPFGTWEVAEHVFSPTAPAFVTIYYPLNVVCHQDMPEELVYEVMKVLIAHAGEFKNYSPGGGHLTPKNLAAMELPVSDFHPGAVRAYRELKAKVGEEYFR